MVVRTASASDVACVAHCTHERVCFWERDRLKLSVYLVAPNAVGVRGYMPKLWRQFSRTMQCVQSSVFRRPHGLEARSAHEIKHAIGCNAAMFVSPQWSPHVCPCPRPAVQCHGAPVRRDGTTKGVWLDQRMQRSEQKHAESTVRHSLLSELR